MVGQRDTMNRMAPMSAADTAVFEGERPRLTGLAYRLLGSLTDTEDVIQDAWLRWQRTDRATIERPAAWLTTVVSRVGLDRLRARWRDREATPPVTPSWPTP
jgi:RNA polymerase sigma-70 factor, ECF subfamily